MTDIIHSVAYSDHVDEDTILVDLSVLLQDVTARGRPRGEVDRDGLELGPCGCEPNMC